MIFFGKKLKRYLIRFFIVLFSLALFSCHKNDFQGSDINLIDKPIVSYEIDNASKFSYEILMLESQKGMQMMSFVIHSSANELFVVDGGYNTDAEYLESIIKSYGGYVDGWFITHYHEDHVWALENILQRNQVEIKQIYLNFPSKDIIKKYEPLPEYFYQVIDNIQAIENKTITRNDDIYQFESLKVKVLRTYNPDVVVNLGNNSSTVYEFNLQGFKIIFLGDLGHEGGKDLIQRVNLSELKCDMLQLSHHGQSGIDLEDYKYFKPRYCLWTTPQWLWDNNNGGGYNSGPWKTLETREYFDKLSVISFISKDGLVKIKINGRGND